MKKWMVALTVFILFASVPLAYAQHGEKSLPEVPTKGMVTMLDLEAHRCIPCMMMAPIIEELKREYKGKAAIVFVDVWAHKVVIARKGSGINKLEDLKGKVVIFGPKLSAARWVAAKMLFEENGINIDKDLKAYSNGGCCEDMAFSIYLKAVDAGVVCDHFLEEHLKKHQELGVDAKQLIVISTTGSVPQRVLAAGKQITNDIVAKVNQALLRLDRGKPEHAKILYRAELGGFQKSKDEDYDGMRILIGAKTAE